MLPPAWDFLGFSGNIQGCSCRAGAGAGHAFRRTIRTIRKPLLHSAISSMVWCGSTSSQAGRNHHSNQPQVPTKRRGCGACSSSEQNHQADQKHTPDKPSQYLALSQSPITPFAVRSAIHHKKYQLPEIPLPSRYFPSPPVQCPFVPGPVPISDAAAKTREEKQSKRGCWIKTKSCKKKIFAKSLNGLIDMEPLWG